MKKKAKKRLPKPVPTTCLCVIDDTGRIYPGWLTHDPRLARLWVGERSPEDRVIRVRITPVAKRRKVAK